MRLRFRRWDVPQIYLWNSFLNNLNVLVVGAMRCHGHAHIIARYPMELIAEEDASMAAIGGEKRSYPPSRSGSGVRRHDEQAERLLKPQRCCRCNRVGSQVL
jgi:hypothetical protein